MCDDGPFTESKEVIGGYAVLELPTREEAIRAAVDFMQFHAQHWPGWEGEMEVRQMYEAPAPEDPT
ncbi:MAG: YciI family protein [Gemmatimonadales bacterium]